MSKWKTSTACGAVNFELCLIDSRRPHQLQMRSQSFFLWQQISAVSQRKKATRAVVSSMEDSWSNWQEELTASQKASSSSYKPQWVTPGVVKTKKISKTKIGA